MSWEEKVFRVILGLGDRVRNRWNREQVSRRVLLEDEQNSLCILAGALSGDDILIKVAEQEGGYAGRTFFLPEQMDFFETPQKNRAFLLYRVVYLSLQRSLKLNAGAPGMSRAESRECARSAGPLVLKQMRLEFPAFFEETVEALLAAADRANENALPEHLLYGRFLYSGQNEVPAGGASNPQDRTKEYKKEIRARAGEELEVVTKPEEELRDYTLTHNFEKIETIDQFDGQWRDLDQSDELEEEQAAMDEVRLSKLIRTDDPAHSVYYSEGFRGATAGDSQEARETGPCLRYDEWHFRKRSYRKDYCRLYPEHLNVRSTSYLQATLAKHRPTIVRLRRQLHHLLNRPAIVYAQTNGEDPDLDAAIVRYADLHARSAPSERVYMSRRRLRHDISLLILLDRSLSTDGYHNGQRILDVEKESALIFGELLREAGVDFAIDAFCSRSRNQCRYTHLKTFEENWAEAKLVVGGLSPLGYTRIGPALRHATRLLQRRDRRHRHLLLISDGKPNDFDRYEGRYGLEDVRQAVREARRSGVSTYTLAVDSQARRYLPAIFDHNEFRILPDARLLPAAMFDFFLHLQRATRQAS